MGLTFFNGTITSTASEVNIFDITGNAHYNTYLFFHNMQAGDTVVFRIYIKDINGNTMRRYDTVTLSDVQTEVSGEIGYLTAAQYKVSIQRTAGTDRAYTWVRAEVT